MLEVSKLDNSIDKLRSIALLQLRVITKISESYNYLFISSLGQ